MFEQNNGSGNTYLYTILFINYVYFRGKQILQAAFS